MEKAIQNIGIIILAAGASTRMGQPKQLLRVGSESLIQRVLRTVMASTFRPVVVVLGANREKIEPELEVFPVHKVFNEIWSSGMGSSISSGLSYLLQEEPSLDAVIILVGDQPLLNTQVLLDLHQLAQVQQTPLVVSHYANTMGVPALFTRALFPELIALEGATGAKVLIQKYRNQAAILEFPEGFLDLDTPEDWMAFVKKINTNDF